MSSQEKISNIPRMMNDTSLFSPISSYNHSKKILVVEDNVINREILCQILEDTYETLQAENGKEALEMLEKHGEEIVLILLDIIMPIMDGYTFLSIIKKDSLYSSIPVIIVTLNDSEEDEVKALSRGATDFIRKPYSPQIVINRVASIIKLRETAAMVNLMKFDSLTGMYSKDYFYRKAEEIILNNPESNFHVICSNIENFSLVNDMYGLTVGDELLCYVANMLTDCIQDRGICGRINADVFAFLVENPSPFNKVKIEEKISELNTWFGRCTININFGIYIVDSLDVSMNIACDRAMSAYKSVKGKFDKLYAYYDDKIRLKKLYIQAITNNMQAALDAKEFQVYFQPKYTLNSETISGAEALVRWFSPTEGFLSPGEFIPVFEKNGFITELDKYVWEETCMMLRKCIDDNIPVVPVSVNVSRTDLYYPELPEFILGLVEKYNLDTELLHLEITESAYTENPEPIIKAVSKLRKYGFIIEMDDFGQGYSSLNMLSDLPIDILKLDMKFVQNTADSPDSSGKNITSFVIQLAKWMNLTVTAEGVETRAQVNRLKDMDCDQAQGYYFARPMPKKDYIALLKKLSENNIIEV